MKKQTKTTKELEMKVNGYKKVTPKTKKVTSNELAKKLFNCEFSELDQKTKDHVMAEMTKINKKKETKKKETKKKEPTKREKVLDKIKEERKGKSVPESTIIRNNACNLIMEQKWTNEEIMGKTGINKSNLGKMFRQLNNGIRKGFTKPDTPYIRIKK